MRAAVFLPQLDENKKLTKENFSIGVQIFLFGLIKKIVIADRLTVCVDNVFLAPSAYSGSALLCSVISYSIQIYCDFSGYSDMAIGMARILGYELTQNFNVPYLAQNPTEIEQYCENTDFAVYSFVYNCAMAVSILNTSFNQANAPWLYRKLKENDVETIKTHAKKLLFSFLQSF